MSGRPDSLSSVFERFLSFERRGDLFRMDVCGIGIWHYIRFPVYSKLVLPCFVTMDSAHPDKTAKVRPRWGWNPVNILRRLWRAFRLRVLRNPMFRRGRCDILIALSPRTTRLADGRRVRLAVDFVVGLLKSTWAVLESPMIDGEYATHDGDGRTFYLEAARAAAAKYRRSAEFSGMKPEMSSAARRIADGISEDFGIEVDVRRLTRTIENAVARDRAAVPLLRRWIRRLGVRCVVEVVHYGGDNMALTKAAHEEGIPVVELQHGTIYPAHAAYNLPVADSPYTPDYLLGWGDYWIRQARNFPAKRAVSTGYPYLEYFLERFPRRTSRQGETRILFISQGTVGRELAEAAVRLSEILPSDRFPVSFKLHPSETRRWRELYPCLESSNVVVVENTAKSVYECFAESDVTVGVCSTALIEGFMWGLKAFIVRDLAGADTMEAFCDGVRAQYVAHAEELAECLRSAEGPSGSAQPPEWREALFRRNAANADAEFIDGVVRMRLGKTQQQVCTGGG